MGVFDREDFIGGLTLLAIFSCLAPAAFKPA